MLGGGVQMTVTAIRHAGGGRTDDSDSHTSCWGGVQMTVTAICHAGGGVQMTVTAICHAGGGRTDDSDSHMSCWGGGAYRCHSPFLAAVLSMANIQMAMSWSRRVLPMGWGEWPSSTSNSLSISDDNSGKMSMLEDHIIIIVVVT